MLILLLSNDCNDFQVLNDVNSEDMRGIKHTQLREMLAYKFPVRIAIDILQNIGRYNFGERGEGHSTYRSGERPSFCFLRHAC